MNKQENKNSEFKIQNFSFLKMAGVPLFAFLILNFAFSPGCKVYRFADVSIPDSIKTVRINFIGNKAQYVNPQLSPNLTDRFKQKVVSQTRLTQTNKDNADYDISGWVSNYAVSTSGISTTGNNQRQASVNRLTVGVHMILNNQLSNQVQEFDVSRSFEFAASLSLQAAEAQLQDEMVRNLTDDIFNRIFSNW